MRDLILISLGALAAILIIKGFKFVSALEGLKLPKLAENTETWEWIDYKGRKRQITVKRIVKLHY